MLTDSYRHKGLRKRLVEDLKTKGITDMKVLNAINEVPRHFFLDSSLAPEITYQDNAVPISCMQTISQPYTVAFQTQLLEIKPNEKILEIGTGSGYQTAILCQLKAQVFTIERHKQLFLNAKTMLNLLGYRVKCFFSDGYEGLSVFAPFDKVLVTCGAPQVPEVLIKQMKIGGTMIIPIGEEAQMMYKITKISETEIEKLECGSFKFVPMLEDKQK
jgi:protein-L-isoaspartate(D-aspartate) O-methyltransferase